MIHFKVLGVSTALTGQRGWTGIRIRKRRKLKVKTKTIGRKKGKKKGSKGGMWGRGRERGRTEERKEKEKLTIFLRDSLTGEFPFSCPPAVMHSFLGGFCALHVEHRSKVQLVLRSNMRDKGKKANIEVC